MRDSVFAASGRAGLFSSIRYPVPTRGVNRLTPAWGSMVGDKYLHSIGSPLWFHPRLNRGLSDFNVAQTQINYTWGLGTPRTSEP